MQKKNSGWGIKSGGASAPAASPTSAPTYIIMYLYYTETKHLAEFHSSTLR